MLTGKKFAVILLFLFFCCSHNSIQGQTYSSLKRDGLKGAISITETSSWSVDTVKKTTTQDSCCINRFEYDKNGNAVKNESVNIQGVLQSGMLTDYHPNGLLKEIRYIDKDHRVTYREEFYLDAAGNYAGGNAYNEDGKLHRTIKITAQNEFGQWTRLNWYSPDGQLYRTEEYTYDGNKKIKEFWKDKDGKITMDMSRKYNEKGEMILEEGIHPFQGTVKRNLTNRIYEYDKLGNWTQYSILSPTGNPVRIIKRNIAYR